MYCLHPIKVINDKVGVGVEINHHPPVMNSQWKMQAILLKDHRPDRDN